MKRGWMLLLALVVFFCLSSPVSAKNHKKIKDKVKKIETQSEVVAVPEPSTALLLLSGLVGAAGVKRKLKKI